jgi:pimeloyl-ACP methyl ester carboxylesterase
MAELTVNATRIHYQLAGPSDAAAVVLVHGFSLDLRMWDDQVPALAERYRVVSYDLRGFGRSAIPESGVHYHHLDDLVGLLDHLAIERAAVVGLSLGGAVALDAVLRHPDRFSALVLVDAVMPSFDAPDLSALTGPIWSAGRELGADAARRLWIGCPLFTIANERPSCRNALRRIIGDYSGWGWTDPDPGTWAEPDCAAQLHRIAVPTLVVVGEQDIDGMRRMSDALAEGILGARIVVLPGLGHMPNMEDPAAFNRIVLRFLTDVMPGSA